MVEHLIHRPKVHGLSPPTPSGAGGERMALKVQANGRSTVVEQVPMNLRSRALFWLPPLALGEIKW